MLQENIALFQYLWPKDNAETKAFLKKAEEARDCFRDSNQYLKALGCFDLLINRCMNDKYELIVFHGEQESTISVKVVLDDFVQKFEERIKKSQLSVVDYLKKYYDCGWLSFSDGPSGRVARIKALAKKINLEEPGLIIMLMIEIFAVLTKGMPKTGPNAYVIALLSNDNKKYIIRLQDKKENK